MSHTETAGVSKRERKNDETTTTATVAPSQVRLEKGHAAYLVVIAGPEIGEMFRLDPGAELVIGRANGDEIQLTDAGVSRRHALIKMDGPKATLLDLGSHNGTYVGDDRVSERVLQDNDIVRIGASTTIKYSITDPLEEEYQRRLVAAALRDSLTGAYNRRYFQERMAAEYAATRRHGTPLSLLLIDIDEFKQVNDRFGHVAGDSVLKSVSHALQAVLRKEDVLARYGGEEFAVLARGTPITGAEKLGERLRKRVESSSCRWQDSPEGALQVTISVGVAQFVAGMTQRQLVEKADQALYAAKRAGKNRVMVMSGDGGA